MQTFNLKTPLLIKKIKIIVTNNTLSNNDTATSKRSLPAHWINILDDQTESTEMEIDPADEYFTSVHSDIDTASEMSWSPTETTTFFSQPGNKKRKLNDYEEDADENEPDNETDNEASENQEDQDDEDADDENEEDKDDDTNLLTNDVPSQGTDSEASENEDSESDKDNEAPLSDSDDDTDAPIAELVQTPDSEASDTTNENRILSEYYVMSDEDDSSEASEIEKLKDLFSYDDTEISDKENEPIEPIEQTKIKTFKDLFGYSESEDAADDDTTDDGSEAPQASLNDMNLDTEEDFHMVFKRMKLK